jgi:hypothetical protein
MDIKPGDTITLEITSVPRKDAARKTLTRLCAKDPQIRRLDRYRKRRRPSRESWIRGGKFWHHQMKSRSAAEIERGRKYTLFASPDVLRDLQSVERWIKVSPA